MDGVYDPCGPNDRLLLVLGMKGSISEFELGVLRARMMDGARSKARRGAPRIPVPIGYFSVVYVGKELVRPRYCCDPPNQMLGLPYCLGFGGTRVDAAIAAELLRALEPMAIEAALEAEHMESQNERRRIVELELQQAQYEAALAERRYAACEPDNRLIAAQLEKAWEAALRCVETCRARLEAIQRPDQMAEAPHFTGLAADLSAAWNAPGTSMRTRQRLVRALIRDIVANVDEATREAFLTIHWRGGQHSQLRVKKPKSG